MHQADLNDVARRTIPLVDLTSLGDEDTAADVKALCAAATSAIEPVAAVCVWPRFVELAVGELAGTHVSVASVANFPDGDFNIALAVDDARTIEAAGGTEVDVVLPWRLLAAGQTGISRQLVQATRDEIGDETLLKVIIESGELIDDDLIRAASIEALDAGADFLKTSTGKTATSATLAAARVMLDSISGHTRSAGLKISGGVRTTEQAADYLSLADEMMGPDWVSVATFRFGASSLLADLIDKTRGDQ